jgi:hypothetical protein
MKILSYGHFVLGILVVIHFAITGQFMKYNYFSIAESDILVRMMLRANHIYILFAGLAHLLLSFALDGKKPHFLHFLASLILIVATVFLNISFYIDPIEQLSLLGNDLGRVMTNYSVKGILAGTGFHLLLLLWERVKMSKN